LSVQNIGHFGPYIFITANTNQLVWLSTFIGNINNSYTLDYLWSTAKFFDFDFLPLDKLPEISISNQPITQKIGSGS